MRRVYIGLVMIVLLASAEARADCPYLAQDQRLRLAADRINNEDWAPSCTAKRIGQIRRYIAAENARLQVLRTAAQNPECTGAEQIMSGVTSLVATWEQEIASCGARQAAPTAQTAASPDIGSSDETKGALCGSLVSTTTKKGALKGPDFKRAEILQCIEVMNKCSYTIDFRVRVSGQNFVQQEVAQPGKKATTCASDDSQSVSYEGMKRR